MIVDAREANFTLVDQDGFKHVVPLTYTRKRALEQILDQCWYEHKLLSELQHSVWIMLPGNHGLSASISRRGVEIHFVWKQIEVVEVLEWTFFQGLPETADHIAYRPYTNLMSSLRHARTVKD